MADAIVQMDKKLHGFAHPDAVLTGVETRSSSPVRIERDENCVSNIVGLYPCGEGAGYAGGIMSAALDGIQTAEAILEAKRQVHTCPECQNLTDREICPICDDDLRDRSIICVVAEPKDVIAMERSREFKGVYHVLHGVISPLNHVTQDDIRIKELLQRVSRGDIREIIMATNPDTEGETTALYLTRLLKPFNLKVTRLAYGVPVGGHLEFSDEVTLTRALEGRREI